MITVKKFKPLEYIGISNYQDALYLSGKKDSFTFYTFMDSNADIREFDAVYQSDDLAYQKLFDVSVDETNFAEVKITNEEGGTDTVQAYFGDLQSSAYSWHNNIKYAINAKISIIER